MSYTHPKTSTPSRLFHPFLAISIPGPVRHASVLPGRIECLSMRRRRDVGLEPFQLTTELVMLMRSIVHISTAGSYFVPILFTFTKKIKYFFKLLWYTSAKIKSLNHPTAVNKHYSAVWPKTQRQIFVVWRWNKPAGSSLQYQWYRCPNENHNRFN